jgi:hypothetical protein
VWKSICIISNFLTQFFISLGFPSVFLINYFYQMLH